MFIKHRYVVIVVSEELFLSTSALYYIELARKLYEKGDIKVYVINNGISVEKYPERCKWLTEGVMLKNYLIQQMRRHMHMRWILSGDNI